MNNRYALRTVAIVEARMTSSRLPGKMMMDVGNKPSLQVLVERLALTPGLDDIILATTFNVSDDPLARLMKNLGYLAFRGSEQDVLGRVLGAAKASRAEVIVEITGDCTLIDPDVVQETIDAYRKSTADFVANCIERPHYPPGFDARVFSMEVLRKLDLIAVSPTDREHVTSFIWENPGSFSAEHVRPPMTLAHPDLFVALDRYDDLALIRRIYDYLYPTNPRFTIREIVNYLLTHPEEALVARR